MLQDVPGKASRENLPLPLRAREGLGVLHLFYRINLSLWRARTSDERAVALDFLETLIATARQQPQTQIVTLSMFARTDLGFMIITPDLQDLNALEKSIATSLGPDVLVPWFTYLSMTEKTDYGPEKSTPRERLDPALPPWEYFCFYPMSEKREAGGDKKSQSIEGHLRLNPTYTGRVQQIVTGSAGLDDWTNGVTLFAHDPGHIKALVQQRLDPDTRGGAEFGPFHNGLPLPLKTIYRRVLLV